MEKRTQFTFYESFRASARLIRKPAERCLAYDILCDYALYGTEPDMDKLPDSVALLFLNARPNLDASRRKAKSGREGGTRKQTGSKQESNGKQTASKTDPPVPLHGDRRPGPVGGDGRIHHRRPVRVGGLPNEGPGEALAVCAPVAGYPDADKGEFL